VSSHLWIGLLLVITIILELCAVAGFYFEIPGHCTRYPRLRLNVDERQSLYPVVPEGDNSLSGLERARLLSDLPVQIGEVNWLEDMGHIAFRSVGTTGEFRLGHVGKGETIFPNFISFVEMHPDPTVGGPSLAQVLGCGGKKRRFLPPFREIN
jgi:hypothetical protein